MNIDTMSAGRELDVLVAEKVMGGKVEHDWDDFDGGDISRCRGCGFFDQDDTKPKFCIPCYSTDIAAAWEVVEKLRESHFKQAALNFHPTEICVQFWDVSAQRYQPSICASTTPLAICHAALKAVGR